ALRMAVRRVDALDFGSRRKKTGPTNRARDCSDCGGSTCRRSVIRGRRRAIARGAADRDLIALGVHALQVRAVVPALDLVIADAVRIAARGAADQQPGTRADRGANRRPGDGIRRGVVVRPFGGAADRLLRELLACVAIGLELVEGLVVARQ